MPYYNQRYLFYVFATIVSLAVPFITIDGNHMFLLSFDKMKLELIGISFDMQELYLIPFLLIMMFIFVFFTTALGGRIWCGWSCPQTIFRVFYRDFLQGQLLGMRKRRNKQKEPENGKNIIAILIWSILSFIASANFMWFFVAPSDFINYIQNPSEHVVLMVFWIGIALFLIYDVIWLQEDFCFYVCPYVRIQSVMYDADTIMPIYDAKRGGDIYDTDGNKIKDKPDEGECIGCMACVTVCPTHIDIRKGLQLECINCLECVDACVPIMAKQGKETLVKWSSYPAVETSTSVKFVRGRTIAYMVALVLALATLFFVGSKKETMLLNINRTSELYSFGDTKKEVKNSYTFLFTNTDSVEHEFYFEVMDDRFSIVRPSKPVLLKSGEKIKDIVVIKTDKEIVSDDRRDTPVTIKIRAFAVDKPKEVSVMRDTVFMYPSLQVINSK